MLPQNFDPAGWYLCVSVRVRARKQIESNSSNLLALTLALALFYVVPPGIELSFLPLFTFVAESDEIVQSAGIVNIY